MIRINLLPEEMRGRGRAVSASRGEGISPAVLFLILLFLLIDAAAFYMVFHGVEANKKRSQELAETLKQKTKLRDKMMPEYEQLIAQSEQLKLKEAILKTLDPPDRILWSQKLNMLCYIVHPQVFITNLKLQETVKEEETKESIKRRADYEKLTKKTGTAPAAVMIPIITQTLTITGITTGKNSTESLNNFNKFWNDLQQYQTTNNRGQKVRFMDGFLNTAVGSGGLDFTKVVGGKEVGQFTITLTTIPMSGEAK